MENDTLDGWVEKYKHYSGYPVVGKVNTASYATLTARCHPRTLSLLVFRCRDSQGKL